MLITSNFSLSHCVFKRLELQTPGLVWERVNIHHLSHINSLSNNKILEVTKVKAFADNKSNIAKMTISLHDSVENTVRKGENAG